MIVRDLYDLDGRHRIAIGAPIGQVGWRHGGHEHESVGSPQGHRELADAVATKGVTTTRHAFEIGKGRRGVQAIEASPHDTPFIGAEMSLAGPVFCADLAETTIPPMNVDVGLP
jgi:hypothetical protein